VQQLPRYTLLLNDILRATNKEHPDYGGLEEALDKIRKLAAFVNEKKREAEDAATVISVLQRITKKRPSDLLTHSRKFVKEGPLSFGENGNVKYKDGYVFLFSDLVVFTSKITNKNEFTYRGQLSLRNSSVENLKSEAKIKFGMVIKNNRNFLLIANTLEDKNAWMRILMSSIFALNSQ
jgi:hypothetical protein